MKVHLRRSRFGYASRCGRYIGQTNVTRTSQGATVPGNSTPKVPRRVRGYEITQLLLTNELSEVTCRKCLKVARNWQHGEGTQVLLPKGAPRYEPDPEQPHLVRRMPSEPDGPQALPKILARQEREEQEKQAEIDRILSKSRKRSRKHGAG